MAESTPRKIGRRHKGERRYVGGKIPDRLAKQVHLACEIEGLTITEMIESALAMRMEHVDLTKKDNQEVLPITMAS